MPLKISRMIAQGFELVMYSFICELKRGFGWEV